MPWLERLAEIDQERRGYLRLAAKDRLTDEELDEVLADLEDARETAVYWFARLITGLAQGDYILAGEAHKRLEGLGYTVDTHQPRRSRGGTDATL